MAGDLNKTDLSPELVIRQQKLLFVAHVLVLAPNHTQQAELLREQIPKLMTEREMAIAAVFVNQYLDSLKSEEVKKTLKGLLATGDTGKFIQDANGFLQEILGKKKLLTFNKFKNSIAGRQLSNCLNNVAQAQELMPLQSVIEEKIPEPDITPSAAGRVASPTPQKMMKPSSSLLVERVISILNRCPAVLGSAYDEANAMGKTYDTTRHKAFAHSRVWLDIKAIASSYVAKMGVAGDQQVPFLELCGLILKPDVTLREFDDFEKRYQDSQAMQQYLSKQDADSGVEFSTDTFRILDVDLRKVNNEAVSTRKSTLFSGQDSGEPSETLKVPKPHSRGN